MHHFATLLLIIWRLLVTKSRQSWNCRRYWRFFK